MRDIALGCNQAPKIANRLRLLGAESQGLEPWPGKLAEDRFARDLYPGMKRVRALPLRLGADRKHHRMGNAVRPEDPAEGHCSGKAFGGQR